MGRYVREMQLFLAVPRGCLQFVIVVFPDHTHLLFMLTSMANIPVQTNIWDQDQTAPMRSGSILIASKTSFNNEQVDDIWVVM